MQVDRSAYGIMCRLADEGPQRLGALASTFGLDPSTITRQVQALEQSGLAQRNTDPSRPSRLDPRPQRGGRSLDQARDYRAVPARSRSCATGPSDCSEFARLLEKFN